MTTARFTLAPDTAKRLALAALSAVSADYVTPVITGGMLEQIDATHVRITATDRYRVHTALLELTAPTPGLWAETIIIPAAALRWLSSNARYYSSRAWRKLYAEALPEITLHVDGERNTLTISVTAGAGEASVSWSGPTIPGHFPPVGRLFGIAREAEITTAVGRMSLEFLGSAGVLGNDPRVKFTVGSGPNKPGPVYVSFTDPATGELYAEAVVQPKLEIPADGR
jgi:hypothetical protein